MTAEATISSPNNKPLFRVSADVNLLVKQLLKDAPETGSRVSFDDLGKTVAADVKPTGRYKYLLTSARRILSRDGINFSTLRDGEFHGLVRMSDQEVVHASPNVIRGMRSRARNEKKRLAALKGYDGLARDDKVRWNTSMTMLSVCDQMLTPKKTAQVEERVRQDVQRIDFSETIKLFLKSGDK